jgi:lactoylglutathione lyase
MVSSTKPRAIGFNHVALEVGDIEETLEFFSRIFDFQLRGKSETWPSSISATNSSH